MHAGVADAAIAEGEVRGATVADFGLVRTYAPILATRTRSRAAIILREGLFIKVEIFKIIVSLAASGCVRRSNIQAAGAIQPSR